VPLALDPAETVDVVLDLDSEKPEPRPTFLARYLTTREHLRLIATSKAGADATTFDDTNRALNQCLTIQLAGWKNIRGLDGKQIPFSSDAFDDVLTVAEKWELLYAAMAKVRLAESDKKKSFLRARSAPAPPAEPAPPASA